MVSTPHTSSPSLSLQSPVSTPHTSSPSLSLQSPVSTPHTSSPSLSLQSPVSSPSHETYLNLKGRYNFGYDKIIKLTIYYLATHLVHNLWYAYQLSREIISSKVLLSLDLSLDQDIHKGRYNIGNVSFFVWKLKNCFNCFLNYLRLIFFL